jgi:hypothetical protein
LLRNVWLLFLTGHDLLPRRYQYRLAPAAGPLNEETFGKTPLPFVGKQGLRWKGGPSKGGTPATI